MDAAERDDDNDRDQPRPRRRRRPPPPPDPFDDPAMRFRLPVHTSGFAIAAGYLGLVSVLCLPAPVALVLGILAIRHLKKNPKLHGYGRAFFAIVMGVIFIAVLTILSAAILIKELRLA